MCILSMYIVCHTDGCENSIIIDLVVGLLIFSVYMCMVIIRYIYYCCFYPHFVYACFDFCFHC